MFTNEKSLENALQREEQSATIQPLKRSFDKEQAVRTPHGVTTEEDLHLYSKAVFSWTAPEYIQHEKTNRWYLIASAVVGILVLGSLVLGNWSFALAIVAFSGVYYFFQKRHTPKNIQIIISKMGVKVGDEVYPYTHIQAFWFFYHPPFIKTLNLRVHKKFFSDIVIQLGDQDPAPIREFLCGEIPEWEGKTEKISEVIIRLLKL